MNINLQADLDKFLKERLDPINRKMVEQENIRHKQFLEKHFEKYNALGEKHDSHISQLITLEGVILGVVIVFTNSQQVTVLLILAVCLILFSLIFGIWSQSIGIQANYQSHEWDYYQELKNNWFMRELWKDETVKIEKQIIEPNILDKENAYEKTVTYRILKVFHLSSDRIEVIFKLSFVSALFLMILHLLSKAPM